MDGTFSNGEGPVMGQKVTIESENAGLISGGEGGGKNLKGVDGPQTMTPPTPGGDRLFDLHSSTYAGPQNMVPANHGVTNPFDINKG